MPIICGPVTRTDELTQVIGDAIHAADSLEATSMSLAGDAGETLVVIGPDTPIDDALAFSARLRLERPAVGVVLIRDRVDVTLLNRALQSGVREVVTEGDTLGLAAACGRSREVSHRMLGVAAQQEAPAEGEIITVFAPKGGVGKTTLATNLGVVLASGGHRACLVDLDLTSGDVAISMQLDPARTIVDAVPMAGHLDTTGAASLLTRYNPALETLLAPVAPGDAEKVSPALVGELLAVLRTMFGYVVVDTPAYLSEHVLAAMDASTHHVLLATPDVPALKNLRVTQDTLDLLSYPLQTRSVVLNRADSRVGLSAEDVERVLHCPIAAHIPSSRAVPLSINNGTPITQANPDHPVSRAIVKFAQQRLLGSQATVSRRTARRLRTFRRAS
jgi:Flp pilus assembly CpaE family ATPase